MTDRTMDRAYGALEMLVAIVAFVVAAFSGVGAWAFFLGWVASSAFLKGLKRWRDAGSAIEP